MFYWIGNHMESNVICAALRVTRKK